MYQESELNLKRSYTLEKHLELICLQNSDFIDLYATWEIDKKTYENMLSSVIYNYPHFSMHDGSHSKSIISNIEMILGEDRIKLLGPTETWMILESAYLHDFGMMLKNDMIEKEWSKDEFQEFLKGIKEWGDDDLKEAADFILNFKQSAVDDKIDNNWPVKIRRYVVLIVASYYRGKHPSISREYIENSESEWGLDLTHNKLIKRRLFQLIGEVSLLHGADFSNILDLKYRCNGLKSDYIHPRFIAEMIRLGDLLDLDNNRFNYAVNMNFGNLPQVSKHHLGKHAAITHLLITPSKIEATANCTNDDEIRETRRWFDMMRSEINDITIHWTDIVPQCFTGYAIAIGRLDILLNGKKVSNKEAELKFEISQKRAFEIIEGSGIYESKLDFLRELIQNALDASKIQLWRDLKNGVYDPWVGSNIQYEDMTPYDIEDKKIYNNYKIFIEIEKAENNKIRIKITDKGIGFDSKSLNNISNVGVSWHKRDNFKSEIKMMPSWLKPTGGFGIGIQSCFMVTDEVIIKSKTNNENGKLIKLKSVKENGYITIIDTNLNFTRGSEIELSISNGIQKTYSSKGYIAKQLEEFDSFDNTDLSNSNEFGIWTIVEYIIEKFQNALFPIAIKTAKGEIVVLNPEDKYFKEMKSATISDRYLFCFNIEDYNIIKIWDKKYSTFLNIRLCQFWEYNRKEIFFKGVKVDCDDSYRLGLINGFSVFCNINGMDTVETLTLDRKNIREECIDEVANLIDDAVKFMIKSYEEILIKNSITDNLAKINMVTLRILIDQNISDYSEEFVKILNEHSVGYVSILSKHENVYLEERLKLSNVMQNFPRCHLIDYASLFYDDIISHRKDFYANIANELIQQNIECEKIILDQFYSEKLLASYPIYSMKFLMRLEGMDIHIYEIYNDELPIGVKADQETIDNILSKAISKHHKRYVTYALEKYENLSVRRVPFELWRRNEAQYKSFYMISPMTNEDIEKISTFSNVEEFESSIINRNDFNNLIEYTFNNRSMQNKATKDQIRSTYKQLIIDIYNNITTGNIKLN